MLLEVRDLHIAYGDIQAVNGATFHLEKGEMVSIIGANGAGKTSILNGIMGLAPSDEGGIRFRGADITHQPAFRRARSGIRLVPERGRVFPRLTVMENLMTGVYGLRKYPALEERLLRLYEFFPILREKQDDFAATLSGGQQQQLSIARALISDPTLLLVDEVSTGLMPKLADQVFEMLKSLNRDHGLTILLVEQNAVASLAVSHRGYVLETGACVHEGPAADLMADPRVKEVYLGG